MSQPNGYPLQNCVTSSIKEGTSTFWDVLCDALFCFPCKFSDNKIFSLRGPCTGVPNVDTKYLFIQDHAEKGIYTFQGFKGQTNIELNLTSKAWEWISLVEGGSILGSFHGKENVPIGVNDWTMFEPCENGKSFSKLKLTKVEFFKCFDCVYRTYVLL